MPSPWTAGPRGVDGALRQRNVIIAAAAVGAIVLIAVGVGAASLIRSGGSTPLTPGTFHAHGIAFNYPVTWTRYPAAQLQYNSGASPVTTDGVGVTRNDVIIVATYRLSRPVGPRDLPDIRAEFAKLAADLARQTGGRVLSGPDQTSVAGLPGLRFRITFSLADISAENRILILFKDGTEYMVNCQHTREHAAEIEQGCAEVEATLRTD